MPNSENNNSLLPISSNTGDALLKKPFTAVGRAITDVVEGIAHLLLDPVRKFNIQREANLEKFKQEVEDSIKNIPEENIDNSKMGVVLKTIEDSRYQLNDDEIRKLFVKLISASLDDRVNSDITPLFSSIISNMTPKVATLLKDMYINTASVVPYVEFQTEEKTTYARNTLDYSVLLLDNNYIINNDLELSLLENFNLIKLNEGNFLSHSHFKNHYNAASTLAENLKIKHSIGEDRKVVMEKSHYSFTPLGKALCKILFE